MKVLFSYLFRNKMYESIPSDDLMVRQRFTLFRIMSFTGFLASIFTAFQIWATFEEANFTFILMLILSAVILVNFYIVKSVEKLWMASLITLLTGFLVVHSQAYTAGGVNSSGTMYFALMIMAAFMLLGSKAGKIFTTFVILNVIYFYLISEYTGFTDTSLFKNDPSLIRQDALTTFIFGLFLVAAQSNYLHSGKNVIIEKISAQKDELIRNNRKLQEYTASLEKSNKELDKFASIVSHDLKAPLRAIGSLTGWIEEDAGDQMSKEVRANFDMIKQRVNRMEGLINAILDYSRADKRFGQDEQVDLEKLIPDTLDFIGKPDNVEMVVTNPLPTIFTDRTRLSQVFSNLIGNAIKYNDKKEIKVVISSVETNEGFTFSVKDNGPGIEPQYHERIFVIFQTLNRRDDVESTGVGLAIVKKIIEDCGGKIWVESDLGQGADFKFFWPKAKKMADPIMIAATIVV